MKIIFLFLTFSYSMIVFAQTEQVVDYTMAEDAHGVLPDSDFMQAFPQLLLVGKGTIRSGYFDAKGRDTDRGDKIFSFDKYRGSTVGTFMQVRDEEQRLRVLAQMTRKESDDKGRDKYKIEMARFTNTSRQHIPPLQGYVECNVDSEKGSIVQGNKIFNGTKCIYLNIEVCHRLSRELKKTEAVTGLTGAETVAQCQDLAKVFTAVQGAADEMASVDDGRSDAKAYINKIIDGYFSRSTGRENKKFTSNTINFVNKEGIQAITAKTTSALGIYSAYLEGCKRVARYQPVTNAEQFEIRPKSKSSMGSGTDAEK